MAKDATSHSELPRPRNAAGKIRRVGVEIELGGLTEDQIASMAQKLLGGDIEHPSANGRLLKDSSLGDVKIYLDTKYRDRLTGELGQTVLKAARAVVPVEIVTDPIRPEDIETLNMLVEQMRKAGAEGTQAGALLGYGVHFNPEITGETLNDILPTLQAFALLEDHIRTAHPIDLSRRALPFVDPYPRALVDRLAEDRFADMDELIDTYLELAPSRNYGLDMLCLFKHLNEEKVSAAMDASSTSARPTYHYRLPDSRVDEPDWSLGLEWSQWCLVEQVANDAALLDELKAAWRDHRASLVTIRTDWPDRVATILTQRGI